MTRESIRIAVMEALTKIAPELEGCPPDPDGALRQEVDLDSIDFLNFLIDLHQRLGVDVPEADYPKLSTINATVQYVAGRLGAA